MMKIRKMLRDKRLIKKRDELVLQLEKEGYYQDEIADIFRLTIGRVSQIIKKVEKNNKLS